MLTKLVQPLWKTVWRFLKKLEIELPYDPAIPLLGTYSGETRIERDTCTPVFTAVLFTIAMTWEQPRCPLADKWTSWLLPCHSYCKQYCSEHWGTRVSFNSGFPTVCAQKWDCWVIWQFYFQFFKKSPHCPP